MMMLMLLSLLRLTGWMVVIYLLLRFLVSYYRFLTNPLFKSIPGPPDRNSYWVGWAIRNFQAGLMDNHIKWWKHAVERANGDTSKVQLLATNVFFGQPSLMPMSAELVQEILLHPSHRAPIRYAKRYARLTEVMGFGLVTTTGSFWQRHRRILQPSFHVSSYREAMELAMAKNMKRILQAWNTRLQLQQLDTNNKDNNSKVEEDHMIIISVFDQVSALTLDVFGEVTLSHEFNGLQVVDDWASTSTMSEFDDPLIRALEAVFPPKSFLPIVLNILEITWLEKYLMPSTSRLINLLNSEVDKVVRKARQNISRVCTRDGGDCESSFSKPKKPKTLLQVLLDSMDAEESDNFEKRLTDVELRDEIKTFIIAGHETSASMCLWILYCLGKYPAAQERIYQEVCQHTTTTTSYIDSDDIANMTYLGAFLNEVLRLYPPIGYIMRFTSREENWAGHQVPPNTRFMIPFFWLHRHPDHWEKPLEFIPERWLDKEANQKRHKFCYMPFSAGGHSCLGKNFALLEGQLFLAYLVRAMEISLPPHIRDSKIRVYGTTTLQSDPPMEVQLKLRQPSTQQ